ncbi:MAG: CHAP domain-containing protein [bacterium]|nr:CHAP domain-containing protein [bacterium]
MKLRSTTPVSVKMKATRTALIAAAFIMAVSAPIAMGAFNDVFARNYDAEIQAAQAKIDAYNKQARKLGKAADTLQTKLDKLTNEKQSIQAEINLSQKEYDKLQANIKKNEKKIVENKDALGGTIADLYVNSNTSPLEMLASSSNIGDYIDKQTQQNSVKDALTETINDITKLKAQLEKQRADVKKILVNQTSQRNALAAKENEQQQLVNDTRGKESAYKKLSSKSKAHKAKLVKAQQAAIARKYSGNGTVSAGNLPAYSSWSGTDCYVDNAGYSHRGHSGNGQDPLGYGCNQCVSYTAWKMGKVTGFSPSYWGNANQWPASARAAGYKVSTKPRANSLGVMMSGAYGHIVYVESYHKGSNTVDISQYNEWINGKGFGYFSTRSGVSGGTYDKYIYL